MPKHAYDFEKQMMFYIIKCNNEDEEEVYIGSTFDFTKRKAQHKSSCNNENDTNYTLKIYQTIRANGGWINYSMYVIDRKVCIDKLEARQHEQTLIQQYKSSLNSQRAYRSNEERLEHQRAHYVKNRETRLEYQRVYGAEHRDARKARDAKNRDALNEKSREYRAKNKDAVNEKQRERRRILKENRLNSPV